MSILVLAALLATPANAEQLSFSGQPLEGSSFQGADGDQDPTATWRDWESLQAGLGVRHLPDANDPDSAFVGGTKVLKPGEWRLTEERDGVDPAKANILDGWTAVRPPRGHTFLYLGFTREEEGGTTSITFELNHDGELWRNPAGAMVPCRQDGDLLVSFQQLGNRFVVLVSSWETTTPATDGRQCALAGRLRLLRDADFPASAVQGWLNAGPIINRLRGGFYDVGDELQAGVFGEAAVDLTELLQAAIDDRCASFASIWMHSRASDEEQSQMQDYVAPQPLAVRTCSASGTKFFDLNANGARETGEPGLPGFLIWADYSPFDGVHDGNEPFAVTDPNGRYVINDIKPGDDGTYMLRETLLTSRRRLRAVANDWVCSYPFSTGPNGRFACAWPPINVNTTHYARGRAFGNWYPAQVTVQKDIFPPDDPGEFELRVGRYHALSFPQEGSSATIFVPPGSYPVSEVATGSTDLADYKVEVHCAQHVSRPGRLLAGPVFPSLELLPLQRATCIFTNVRLGAPAISIWKQGEPAIVEAGETVTYSLYVHNPGFVSFAEDGIRLTDENCDDTPELVDTGGDETLDPGDTWIYRCSRSIPAPGDDCGPGLLENRASVDATAPEGSASNESPTIETILLCPDQPTPPTPVPPEPPGPPEPGPVVPPGPTPPVAGEAGRAGVLVRRAIGGCIGTRAHRVNLRGTRMSRVRVYVNGGLRRRLTVETLQRRVTARVTVPPGRYRIAVRVTFERGSGTPAVTLRDTFRTCAAQVRRAPAVTG